MKIKLNKNQMMWGVDTDKEVKKICEQVKNHPNYFKLTKKENIFHKLKSEWTTEMIKQKEEFDKNFI